MKKRLGLFRLGGRRYAVPLECLLQVIAGGQTETLPLIPDGMAGMLVVNDQVIPLLDSNWLPGNVAGRGLDSSFKILVATECGPIALPADETIGIVANSRGNMVATDQDDADFLPDCFCYGENSYQVLNVDLLIMSLIRS